VFFPPTCPQDTADRIARLLLSLSEQERISRDTTPITNLQLRELREDMANANGNTQRSFEQLATAINAIKWRAVADANAGQVTFCFCFEYKIRLRLCACNQFLSYVFVCGNRVKHHGK
jgi:hypothetical protein